MKPINFAVAGSGHIGKRHAEMISRNPDANLVALIDTASRPTLGLDRWPDIPFYQSLERFLQSDFDAEVVIIAAPNGLHAQLALKCLNAGKHVVIEKPMVLNTSDAEKIIFRALNVNKYVFSVMQNRYSPPAVWLKGLVDSGILGEIYQVQTNCLWNRDERYYKAGNWHGSKYLDGGTLFTQFSHFIDILYWIFGDVDNILSKFATHNHHHLTDFEDSGFVTFDFRQGGIGSLSFTTSAWDRNLESSMTIIAENGCIKIGGQYMNEVEYCHVKNYEMPVLEATNPANDYGAYKGSAANHHFVIDNVIKVLRGNGVIATNALEGLKVVDIIERIYKSSVNQDRRSAETMVKPYRPPVINQLQEHFNEPERVRPNGLKTTG